MALFTQVRPSLVAVRVALSQSQGQPGRLCRIVICFPDIGRSPVTEKLGYVPWATPSKASELVHEHQPELTIITDRSNENGWN